MDGVININKPAEWTSQDVCAKLRSRLGIKRIGHTGTLDPMATGVLPVCIGKATRMIEYYDCDFKTYRATMLLGTVTDTLDITGDILETRSCAEVTENAVREAFNAYIGTVEQLPPKYSALKVGGKRAYELAREGKDFELKPRKIEITRNEILDIDLKNGTLQFEVTCSKGTYIRTIIDDIGRTLGCGACMTSLTRTVSGFFRIEDSVDINDLCSLDENEISRYILPIDETLLSLGMIELDDNRVTAFMNGNSSYKSCYRIEEKPLSGAAYRVYSNGFFLGVALIENGSLVPRKVYRNN